MTMVWNVTIKNEIRENQSRLLEGINIPTYNDIMEEFRNNGVDIPFEPEESFSSNGLSGLGPARPYLTQRSCPETLYSSISNYGSISPQSYDSGIGHPISPILSDSSLSNPSIGGTMEPQLNESWSARAEVQREFTLRDSIVADEADRMLQNYLTDDQIRVLNTIPPKVLYCFLNNFRKLDLNKKVKDKICRFCKNNGECEAVYRSHKLRSEGKLSCPVLRHLVCARCGATGDDAHTIKYCTAVTPDERRIYELLMLSRRSTKVTRPAVRIASNYVPVISQDGADCNEQLPPQWQELERKLTMQE